MSNEEQNISPVVVVFVSITISLLFVAGIFFVKTGVPQLFLSPEHEGINSLLEKGNPAEALDMINAQSGLEKESDTSLLTQGKAWYLLAWKRYEKENWKSYAKDPKDWFVGDDVNKAVSCLARSSKSPETYLEATTMLGVIYMEKGWYQKAKSAFEDALRANPKYRDAFLYYGVSLSRLKQSAMAIKHLEKWENYLDDCDFVKNLFYLYLFDAKNYEVATNLGDTFLKIAVRGNPDIVGIKRELLDLSVRFPEFFNDDMTIIKDRPPEYKKRKK
jgi:tetratricopeptide (TPR) repeat protein